MSGRKIASMTLALCLALTAHAWSAIAFGSAFDGGYSESATVSFSYTVLAGSQRLLVACVTLLDDGAGFVSAGFPTYAGVSMMLAGSRYDATSALRVHLYYLTNPATGPNTYAVQTTGLIAQNTILSSYSGVDQVTPASTFTSTVGTGGTPSLSVTATVGSVVVDCAAARTDTAGTNTAGAGQAEREDQATNAIWIIGVSDESVTASPVTMSWTTDGTEWVQAAMVLKQAVALTRRRTRAIFLP